MTFEEWYAKEWPRHQYDSGGIHANLKALKWAVTGLFTLQLASISVSISLLVG